MTTHIVVIVFCQERRSRLCMRLLLTRIDVNTRTAILTLLHREPHTVAELASALGVTRNAIIVQLRLLLAEGLVRRGGGEARGGVGKPAARFEAVPGNEDISSSAHRSVLISLVSSLSTTLPPDTFTTVIEETGRRLAHDAGLGPHAGFEASLKAAMAAADSLGARTEAVAEADGILIRNHVCPLGAAVRADGCVCRAMAAFFSEATGRPATEQCIRGEKLTCQYFIHKA